MRRLLPLALAACPLLFSGAEEPAGPAADGAETSRVHLYADVLDEGNIRNLLSEATRAEQAGEYDKAITWYELGLTKYGESLYPTGTSGLYRPLEAWVRERLNALPPEILARYRLRQDAEADVLLQAAREKADAASARQALERFGLSSTGRRAAALLGELDLEREQPAAAARAWEAAVQDPTLGGDQDPLDLARLALLKARQGRGKEAADLAALLAAKAPGLTLSLGGEEVQAPALAAWLQHAAPPSTGSHSVDWPTVGGNMSRNAACPDILWVEPSPGYERELKTPWSGTSIQLQQMQQRMGTYKLKPLLPCHGAVDQGALVFSCGDRMVFVDVETGKLSSKAPDSGWPDAAARIQPQVLQNLPPRPLAATLADGIAVASLLRPTPNAPMKRGWGRMGGTEPRFGLVAREMSSGKLRWYFPEGVNEEEFDGFDVRTAPVVCGDVLVAACTRATTSCEVWLVGLDLKGGRLLWRRFLCASPFQNGMFGMSFSAEPGLAAEGNLVVCSTQRGAVVAVDAETGRTRWACRYEEDAKKPPPPQQGLRAMGRGLAPDLKAMTAPWKPFSPPVISGGTAFVLPADADQVLALDAVSGRLLWQKQTDADQVLGLSRGRLVLTGGSKGILLSADQGAEVFRFSVSGGGICGRGLITQSALLLPTLGGIQTVDLSTGKLGQALLTWPKGFTSEPGQVQQGQPTPPKAGGANLLLAGSRLFALGVSKILSYRVSDAPEEFLLSAVQDAPADPGPRLRLARHYRASGQDPKALEVLRQAWKDLPSQHPSELSDLLADQLEEGARKASATDPRAAVALLQEALRLPLPASRESILRLALGKALALSGDRASALDTFQDTMARLEDASASTDSGGGQASMSVSGLARREIADLLKSDPSLIPRREEQVRARLKTAAGDEDRLLALASAFPESVEADRALLDLGVRRMPSAPEKALRLLGACALRHPGGAEALQALDAMADQAQATRNAAWRAALLRQISEQMAQGPADPATAALRRRLQDKAAAAAPTNDPWEGPGSPFPLAEAWTLTANERTGLLSRPGQDLTDWSGCLFLSSGMMVDAGTGKMVWQAAPPSVKAWMGIQYNGGGEDEETTIQSVRRGSPAERAGLKAGDALVSIDGRKLGAAGLRPLIQNFKPGQVVALHIQREGQPMDLDLQLVRAPAEMTDDPSSGASDTRFRWSAPAGSLLLAGSPRELCAFDAASRELRWRLPLVQDPPADPGDPLNLVMGGARQVDETTWNEVEGRDAFAAFPGLCVLKDETGALQGVDVEKGKLLWRISGETFREPLRAAGADVLALASDACLLIARETGQVRLRIPTPGGLTAPPLLLADRLVLPYRNRLACVSLVDGKTLWEAKAGPTTRLSATAAGAILAAGEHDLAVLNAATGEPAWSLAFAGMSLADLLVEEDAAYLGMTAAPGAEGGDQLLAISLKEGGKGEVLWKAPLDAEASCRRPLKIGHLVAVDAGRDPSDPRGGTNAIRFLDARTGRREGSLMLPWNRGRVRALRRAGPLLILETSSGIYGYAPKGDAP